MKKQGLIIAAIALAGVAYYCAPGKAHTVEDDMAKLWDKWERQALELAAQRDKESEWSHEQYEDITPLIEAAPEYEGAL